MAAPSCPDLPRKAAKAAERAEKKKMKKLTVAVEDPALERRPLAALAHHGVHPCKQT
jgi:hypothetical protein